MSTKIAIDKFCIGSFISTDVQLASAIDDPLVFTINGDFRLFFKLQDMYCIQPVTKFDSDAKTTRFVIDMCCPPTVQAQLRVPGLSRKSWLQSRAFSPSLVKFRRFVVTAPTHVFVSLRNMLSRFRGRRVLEEKITNGYHPTKVYLHEILDCIGATASTAAQSPYLQYKDGQCETFLTLPVDIIVLLLSHMRTADIMRLGAVCRTLRDVTRDDWMWNQLVQRTFVFADNSAVFDRKLSAAAATDVTPSFTNKIGTRRVVHFRANTIAAPTVPSQYKFKTWADLYRILSVSRCANCGDSPTKSACDASRCLGLPLCAGCQKLGKYTMKAMTFCEIEFGVSRDLLLFLRHVSLPAAGDITMRFFLVSDVQRLAALMATRPTLKQIFSAVPVSLHAGLGIDLASVPDVSGLTTKPAAKRPKIFSSSDAGEVLTKASVDAAFAASFVTASSLQIDDDDMDTAGPAPAKRAKVKSKKN
eukprot:TRINITY_DN11982_c0_g1_i1.p1 TRINITY_DN11982_c0_g1~~TRINITY_DN11982_c0_g1_i1.p1  ORF type:complete len:493 (-),score=91.68 TRINITY_DN11982_c0_g1_i1:1189-2607(-)